MGPYNLWWISLRTLVVAVCHSWFMFYVRTLLLSVIFSVEIIMCPPFWPTTIHFKPWFALGLLILSHSWMKSNGSHTIVLGTYLTKQWCGRRGVLEGVLGTPWKWIMWNWDSQKDQRPIVNLWRIDMRYIVLNATKPATTDEDVKRTYIVRILNPSLFYFWFCLIVFTLWYASFIYVSFYISCVAPYITVLLIFP
jgi:hypothetical protein